MIDGVFRISLYNESVKFPDLWAGKAIRHFMPEEILIKILVTKGTTITVDEIVEEYLKSDVNKK